MAKRRRREERVTFRFPIKYERMSFDGSLSMPVTALVRDLGLQGASFYAQEKLELNSKIKMSFSLPEHDEAYLFARVARVALSDEPEMDYIIGVDIEKLDEKGADSIRNFLLRHNIHNALESIKLTNVMDIHFVAGYPLIIKRFGKLEVTEGQPYDEITLRNLLLGSLDSEQYRMFLKHKELNYIFMHRKGFRFRVNLHVQQGKVEGVFRVIPSQVPIPTRLGFPLIVEKLLNNANGLLLVAGRTGAGKTTTLASMVDLLNNKRESIIISIEKPIEYIHTNKKCLIKQREVGKDTDSFYAAAKNALRQNPDVLVIGEILDRETMEVAIAAAESGTLVLTTIHAPSSSQALDRIASFFPPEVQRHILGRLSLVLKGVVTQNLIPRVDRRGLAVAAEVLVMDSALKHIIKDGLWAQIPTAIQVGKKIGMQSMEESLDGLYRKGIIDIGYLREYL